MKVEYSSATVLSGKDASKLSRRKRKAFALQWSKEVAIYPQRMRPMTVGEARRSISEGNAVFIFGKNERGQTRSRLAAASRIVPAKDETGADEDDVVELGALAAFESGNGYGKIAVVEGVQLATVEGVLLKQKVQKKRVKALVHVDNPAGNGVMLGLGGKFIQTRPSNYVKELNRKNMRR